MHLICSLLIFVIPHLGLLTPSLSRLVKTISSVTDNSGIGSGIKSAGAAGKVRQDQMVKAELNWVFNTLALSTEDEWANL